MQGLARFGAEERVSSAMQREFPVVTPDTAPEQALKGLSSAGTQTIPVLRDRRLVGVLTADNVMEYLLLHGAVPR